MAPKIIRRLLVPLIASGLLLAAGAGSALAKCEGPNPPAFCEEVMASVDFDNSGGTLRAGTETPVRVWISRGEQPLDASSVTLVFARIADATVVRAVGTPSGEAGLWRAEVNLPAGGGWTLVAEVAEVDGIDGAMQRLTLDTLRVREPLTPPAAQPATPLTPSTPALPIALLVAGLAAAALAATGLRQRTRRGASAG